MYVCYEYYHNITSDVDNSVFLFHTTWPEYDVYNRQNVDKQC